jgi:CrcB protein
MQRARQTGAALVNKFLLIALGGAAGSLLRYSASGLAQRALGPAFPFGTVLVNMLGCLLFGLVWAVLEPRLGGAAGARMLLLTGFMGAFTTYSTYMFETVQLARGGQLLLAAANVGGQTALGFALVLVGMALGRMV